MGDKVLLMGNGSSVLDMELGERIDNEFDYVFRINRFRTKGYEKHVGTTVSGWFLADTGVQWLRNPTEEVEGFATHSEFRPYVSTIGLYNDQNDLLAIGKLGRPIKNDDDLSLKFIVRFDI